MVLRRQPWAPRPQIVAAALAATTLCACSAGSDGEAGHAETEQVAADPPAIPLLATYVTACLELHPKRGQVGPDLDVDALRNMCLEVDIREPVHEPKPGLCDPGRWISVDAAVCIAKSSGLPVSGKWKVHLEMQKFPRVLHWWVSLEGEMPEFRRIDVLNGEVMEFGNMTKTVFGNTWP